MKGKDYHHHIFKAAFYGKKNINFGKMRAQYLNRTKDLKEILVDIFLLAKSEFIKSPNINKKYKFYKNRK